MSEHRVDLPEMPERIAMLPVHRGYPVPWFVGWLKDGVEQRIGHGEPDFRVVGAGRIVDAHLNERCWVCGGKRGRFKAFVVGPMCAVNRVSAEPPSHAECAEWSARACPFLTRPHMDRREGGLPTLTQEPAGIMLRRNPGLALVWVTKTYWPDRAQNGVIFRMGEPERVAWIARGRDATREEVEESIQTGLPYLEELARAQGPIAVAKLDEGVERARKLLPA